jgi:hypothetical protein
MGGWRASAIGTAFVLSFACDGQRSIDSIDSGPSVDGGRVDAAVHASTVLALGSDVGVTLFEVKGGNVVELPDALPVTVERLVTDLSWGDFDGDGRADLAVATLGDAFVYGQSDAGFEVIPLVTSIRTQAVAWGNWDGQAGDEVAIATAFEPNQVFTFAGGEFTAVWTSVDTEYSGGAAWGDFDNDGIDDLAIANTDLGQRVQVFRNLGAGLQLAWESEPDLSATGVAWADVDGDGNDELAVCGLSRTTLLFKRVGTTFEQIWAGTEVDRCRAVAWADYDGDGDPDLAVANDGDSNRVYENVAGTLMLAWSSTEAERSQDVAWLDYDATPPLDLAFANFGEGGSVPNRIYRASSSNSWEASWETSAVGLSIAASRLP